MYEHIAQPIEVLVAFRHDRIEPISFKWEKRHYKIQKINLIHAERQGREKLYIFSVTDDAANAYRLQFSSDNLKWSLEDMATM